MYTADKTQNFPNLLIVDDEPSICTFIQQYFQGNGYTCSVAHDGQEALNTLNKEHSDLVLTDVRMPVYDGTYLLQKVLRYHPDVAVIMMTGVDDTQQAVECLRMGAYDYILKPLELETLHLAVQRALERRNLLQERERYRTQLEEKVHARTLELVKAYDEIEKTYHHTLEALVSALDLRERNTAGHAKRAEEYTRLLAMQLGIRGHKLIQIKRGALLHDVGKIGIPDTILLKPGKLTESEWTLMRKHPVYGYEMLRDIKFLEKSLDIVLYHHERWDGMGYPEGLRGEEIPIGARIFAVVDAFDAITSHRVYCKAKDFKAAQQILVENIKKQFDQKVVEAFIDIPIEKVRRIYHLSLLEAPKKILPEEQSSY